MSIVVVCPQCRRSLSVAESHLGGTIACPVCKASVQVSAVVPIPQPPEPQPGPFDAIEETPRLNRNRPIVVKFPAVFYVAAGTVIFTCLMICGGCVRVDARVRDTRFWMTWIR